MFSSPRAVPQTMPPLRSPHRTLRQLPPPQSVPQTTFCTSAVLQTMLPSSDRVLQTMFSSLSRAVLQTMLPSSTRAVLQTMLPSSLRAVLQTMLPSLRVLQTILVPHTTDAPDGVDSAPHVTSSDHAL